MRPCPRPFCRGQAVYDPADHVWICLLCARTLATAQRDLPAPPRPIVQGSRAWGDDAPLVRGSTSSDSDEESS